MAKRLCLSLDEVVDAVMDSDDESLWSDILDDPFEPVMEGSDCEELLCSDEDSSNDETDACPGVQN